MQTCRVEGCARDVFVKSRALCKLHYNRWWRGGDVQADMPPRLLGADRWKTYYEPGAGGCWIWTGPHDKHGYGEYYADGRTQRAHRYVYAQLVRPLRADETLDHLCRRHACVNPEHLDPVSHAENVQRGNAGKHNSDKTQCPQGHPYDEQNTRWKTTLRGTPARECIACLRKRSREIMRAKRGTSPDVVPNGEKTHCLRGHEFTPENTIKTKGGRACRECGRAATRDYMRRKRAAAKGASPPD